MAKKKKKRKKNKHIQCEWIVLAISIVQLLACILELIATLQ